MENNVIRVAQIIGMSDGGVASIIMSLYRAIDKSKVQFDFFVESESKIINREEIESMGGKVIIIPSYSNVFKYMKTLKKLFIEGKYDIVHSNMSTLSIFSLRAAKKAGIKVRICHSHSTSNRKEWKKNIMKNMLRPFSKKYATHYFACSELAGRYLFGNKTFDKGLVTIINNAIDLDKFKYDEKLRNKKRKELGIKDDTLIIGHIGRFVAQKNHTFLIDIFNELHKENKNSILLLVGQGPLVDIIKEKVKRLGLIDSVKFLGQRNDVNELYQVFDVLLLPSLYEGLPVVGIEAQASGNLCYFSDDMTKETKVLDSTKFMSIDISAKDWADEVLDGIKKYKKHNTKEEVSRYGFNIDEEAKKLDNDYITLLKAGGM